MLSIKLLICIGIICLISPQSAQTKDIIIFDRFEICEQRENISAAMVINKLGYAKNIGSLIDGTIYIYRNGFNIKFIANLIRCANRESLDTCEKYTNFIPKNTCMFLSADFMAWSPTIKKFVPPLKCPAKKGTYILTNGTFDPDMFKFFPIKQYYWKTHFNFYDDNNLMFTVCAEYKVAKAVN